MYGYHVHYCFHRSMVVKMHLFITVMVEEQFLNITFLSLFHSFVWGTTTHTLYSLAETILTCYIECIYWLGEHIHNHIRRKEGETCGQICLKYKSIAWLTWEPWCYLLKALFKEIMKQSNIQDIRNYLVIICNALPLHSFEMVL